MKNLVGWARVELLSSSSFSDWRADRLHHQPNKNNTKNNNCLPFSGGSFHVNFVVNGGEELPNMLVGIACSPDSYLDLPIPVRDGYNFDGWYYDNEFTKKIDFTNSIDFKPISKFDNKKCQIGFEDIEIYAKWEKVIS